MQEEYWAALNETLWEKHAEEQSNTIATQSNTIATQSNTIAELRQLLKQAGIAIPSDLNKTE